MEPGNRCIIMHKSPRLLTQAGGPMSGRAPQDVTLLLQNWCRGDQAALDRLIPLVYDELHRLAHIYMVRERPGHTLQTSALVNEA